MATVKTQATTFGAPKKADVILQKTEQVLVSTLENGNKLNALINQNNHNAQAIESHFKAIEEKFSTSGNVNGVIEAKTQELAEKISLESQLNMRQVTEVYNKLVEENAKLKNEFLYLSQQMTVMYNKIAELFAATQTAIAEKDITPVIDYNELAKEVAARLEISVPAIDSVDLAKKVAENLEVAAPVIDAEELAKNVAENLEVVVPAIDTNELAEKVAERIQIEVPAVDEENIARLAVEFMPAQEVTSADEIASKVAEQIVPVTNVVIETDEIVEAISQNIIEALPALEIEVDTPAIAAEVSDRVIEALPTLETKLTDLDKDELGDAIARKVGTIARTEYDIIVDDEGCASLADAIWEKLQQAELVKPVSVELPDFDALAQTVVDEVKDYIAAQNESLNTNAQEVANKVAQEVIEKMPQENTVNTEEVVVAVQEAFAEQNKSLEELGIVLDEAGIEQLKQAILANTDTRLTVLEYKVDEIKNVLDNGIAVIAETAVTQVEEVEEQEVVALEEEVPTVEEVLAEEEAVEEEAVEEVVEEETAEEQVEEVVEEEEVVVEVQEEVQEAPQEEGEQVEEGEEGENKNIFANMMKYNRSFIARIIQSEDDVKNYYGAVKTALLSYKRVNSNIAWGAERFNKGRETIARLKIRGKTLCLYLALDPNEYKTSVYHHTDVSDNKSLHGTPMMVKIKSPLGVKKAIRLIDELLAKRAGIKVSVAERDYAAMYPYETMEELIEEGLVKDVK